MAGFFSLGNDNINRRNINSSNNNNNHISYRNEQQIISYQEIDNKNSELWHLHSSGGGLLAPTEDGDEITRSNKSNSNSNSNRYNLIRMSMGSSGSGNTINCQDCGNQAKKDCVYMRCRTCCKSRGFDCVTHVKSTWVPASIRRERHQNLIIQDQHQPQQRQQQQQEHEHYYMGVVNPKRRRDNNSSSSSLVCTQLPITTSTSVTNTNTTASFSGMELRNFPAEVSSEAVFRCVRVSSVDETDEEYAYQTAVNIGGHVFKGILYDHGPDHPHQSSAPSPSYVAGETVAVRPTASIGGPTAAASIMPTSSSSPAVGYLDPSFYPLTYMSPGTPFFSNPNQRP